METSTHASCDAIYLRVGDVRRVHLPQHWRDGNLANRTDLDTCPRSQLLDHGECEF